MHLRDPYIPRYMTLSAQVLPRLTIGKVLGMSQPHNPFRRLRAAPYNNLDWEIFMKKYFKEKVLTSMKSVPTPNIN
jgi:hypothetical protein